MFNYAIFLLNGYYTVYYALILVRTMGICYIRLNRP